MSSTPAQSIGYAARKLRICVTMCCWVLGLSLLAQVVGWSLATYTDLRFETVEPEFRHPLVVQADHSPRRLATSTATSFADVLEPVPVHTAYDRLFGDLTSVTMATGTMSCLVLLPLMLVSVMLASSRASGKVHHAISALIWTTIIAALALPLSGVLDLPWQDGALHSYDRMVSDIDAHNAGTLGTTSFYGRFVLLPMLCALGAILVGWRFSLAVEGMMPTELPHLLDPALEREASNIRASTLHGGGRVAAALHRSVAEKNQTPTLPQPDGPNARSVSPGKPLKRLI